MPSSPTWMQRASATVSACRAAGPCRTSGPNTQSRATRSMAVASHGASATKVVHRLVTGADLPRIDPRRHRLDALALPRQAQPGDVGQQGFMAIAVAEGRGQVVHVASEAVGARGLGGGHASRLPAYPMTSLIFLTQ